MKLFKLLALAVPVCLLASCQEESEREVFNSINSKEITETFDIDATKVINYELTVDEARLAELTSPVQSWSERTNSKDKVRVFVKSTQGKTSGEKDVTVYTTDSQATINSEVFDAFKTSKELKVKLSDSSNKTLLAEGGSLSENLFKDFTYLMQADFSGFDFKATTSLKGLFQDATEFTTAIFTGSKLDNVKSYAHMFEGTKVTSVVVPGLKTKGINDYSYMFKNTTYLDNVDLSDYDFSDANNISYMFENAGRATVTAKKPTKYSINFKTKEASELNRNEWNKPGSLVTLGSWFTQATKAGVDSPVLADFVFKDSKRKDKFEDVLTKEYLYKIDSNQLVSIFSLTASSITSFKISDSNNDFLDDAWALASICTLEDPIVAYYNSKNNAIGIAINNPQLETLSKTMFNAFTNLESITITPKAGAMLLTEDGEVELDAFNTLTNLTSVNIDGFDFKSTDSIEGLFKGLSKLANVSMKNIVANNLDDVTELFMGTAITSTKGFVFDTKNIKYFTGMFKNTTKLQVVDLSDFDFTNALDVSEMFYGAGTAQSTGFKITRSKSMDFTVETATVDNRKDWKVPGSKVRLKDKFVFAILSDTKAFPVYAGSIFDTTKQDIVDGLSKDASIKSADVLAVSGLEVTDIKAYQVITDLKELPEGFSELNTSIKDKYRIFFNPNQSCLILFTKEQQSTLDNTLISSFTSLEKLVLNSKNALLAGSGTLTLNFTNNTTIKEVDFTNFDFQATTSFANMFKEATALEKVTFKDALVNKVTDLTSMFEGCTSLTSTVIDLNTTHVVTFDAMFKGTTKLATIDLSAYSFINAKSIASMFENASTDKSVASVKFVANSHISKYGVTQATLSNKSTWQVNDQITQDTDYFVICDQSAGTSHSDSYPVKATNLYAGASKVQQALTGK